MFLRLHNTNFHLLTEPLNLPVKVLELPYDGNDFSMSIVLPNRGTKLSEIEGKIDLNFVNNLLSAPKRIQRVNIKLPKFKLEYQNEVVFFFYIF